MDFLKDKKQIENLAKQINEIDKEIKDLEEKKEFLISHPLMNERYRALIESQAKQIDEIDISLLEDRKICLLRNFNESQKLFLEELEKDFEYKKIKPLKNKRKELFDEIKYISEEYICKYSMNTPKFLYEFGNKNCGKWKISYDIIEPYYQGCKQKGNYTLCLECESVYDINHVQNLSITKGYKTNSFTDKYYYSIEGQGHWRAEELKDEYCSCKTNWTRLYFNKMLNSLGVCEKRTDYNGLFDDVIEDYLISMCKKKYYVNNNSKKEF